MNTLYMQQQTHLQAHSKFLEMFNNIFYGTKNILKIAKKNNIKK